MVAKSCTCSGNCSDCMCPANTDHKKSTSPPTCGAPLTSGDTGTYCRKCACNVTGCTRPKSSGADFCTGHQPKKSEYTSTTGICCLPKSWSTWALRTTAERATLFRDLEPCDLEEFDKLALPLLASLRDRMLGGHELLHLWAGAYMKWPIAIEAWKNHFFSSGVTAGLVTHATKQYYVNGCAAVAKAIAGKDLGYMHEMISRKSMAHTMGAQRWLQRLRMLEKVDVSSDTNAPVAKRRHLARLCQPSAPGPVVDVPSSTLCLGQTKQMLVVSSHEDVWSEIVAVANATRPMKLPESAAEMLQFIKEVKEWLQTFPKCMCQSGHDDKKGKRYLRRHIQRKIILAVTKHYDATEPNELGVSASSVRFGSLTKADLDDCIADQGQYMDDLDATMTWREMESAFSMRPLMISCWCCLLGDVKEMDRTVFDDCRKHSALRAHARKLADAHGGVAPTPGALARRRQDYALRGG